LAWSSHDNDEYDLSIVQLFCKIRSHLLKVQWEWSDASQFDLSSMLNQCSIGCSPRLCRDGLHPHTLSIWSKMTPKWANLCHLKSRS
jgi:hypothetical protein